MNVVVPVRAYSGIVTGADGDDNQLTWRLFRLISFMIPRLVQT